MDTDSAVPGFYPLSGQADNTFNVVIIGSKLFRWNEQKNELLKLQRGVSFEAVVEAIAEDNLLDILEHPNEAKYPGQRLFVVRLNEYAYVVPFIETENELFLKTSIPSREAAKRYLRSK